MSFGRMPIANGFLTEDQISDEYFFELAPAFCNHCKTLQLVEQPEPQKMFHENYAFFSGTSAYMKNHFAAFADSVMKTRLAGKSDPFVVELGSNDGIMLRNFKEAGIRHLGVEPSANVAAVAQADDVETLVAFFGPDTAARIRADKGPADAILAANVMCHIPDLNGVAQGFAALLAEDGVVCFEDPYLGAMIEKTSYDQLYDEHVFIFSAHSVANAFAPHGLSLIDVAPQITHGGSMRYTLGRSGAHRPSDAVERILAQEKAQGLDKAETYEGFRRNCENTKAELTALLRKLKDEGAHVVGYGATSKSTTVLNYCGIGPELIEFISDTTPIKQGKLTPGMHIPVKPHDAFQQLYPDYAVLFAWNHAAEIMAKEGAYADAGGKWIHFVPDVRVEG